MEAWTTERVLALAPDAASEQAARKLAWPGPWSEAGRDARAAWGSCRGSGRTPYEVQVDFAAPAFNCSCPSRKFPCKHALALMLLAAEESDAVPPAPPPERVTTWLSERDERDERAVARRSKRADGVADPEAAAKRLERRAERTAAGMVELRRWLEDVVRQGLGTAQQQPYAFWDRVAARMVDAQAPGAGSRVRRLAGIAYTSDEQWAPRLLEELGLLYLLVEAHDRLGDLPEDVQADVRSQLGWPVASEDVMARAEPRARWTVIGRAIEETDYLLTQRTWLVGEDGRPALVLDFAPPNGTLDPSLGVGTVLEAELAFYPSAAPLRALVARKHGEEPAREPVGVAHVDDILAQRAAALARNPWVERWPVALQAAIPVRIDGERWEVQTGDRAMPLVFSPEVAAQSLLALSGGQPIGVYGEWSRGRLLLLAAHAEGRTVPL